MKFYEIGAAVTAVLGVVYGVGIGQMTRKRPEDPGVRRLSILGAFALLAVGLITLVLYLTGR